MNLNPEIEEQIKNEAMKYLVKGRVGYDAPHTLAAVHYMRELIKNEGGDERILVTTMYLHDLGYPELKPGYTIHDVKKTKKEHPTLSVKRAREVLEKINDFTTIEIEKILFLILHHDDLEGIDTHDQQLVFEADNLGKIDPDRVKPSFKKDNCLIFLKHFKEKRMPLFKTKTGKAILNKLLPKLEKYVTAT